LIDDVLARVFEELWEESSIGFGWVYFLPVRGHVNILSSDRLPHINTQLLVSLLNFALIDHLYAH
jgi:hypothetical protein